MRYIDMHTLSHSRFEPKLEGHCESLQKCLNISDIIVKQLELLMAQVFTKENKSERAKFHHVKLIYISAVITTTEFIAKLHAHVHASALIITIIILLSIKSGCAMILFCNYYF